MLLIPGECLAILRRSLEFHHVRFFEKPQHRGSGKPQFQIQAKRQAIGEAEGDNKIAAIVGVIGNNGEGSA
jgi:hypothetical protein